ncbi:hypothetical protein DBR17_07085 [Sphingomonas sp. HMWF008]|nr:hypothetical protein DBR17_07085 [Sphingomonas sp. HMWF008]
MSSPFDGDFLGLEDVLCTRLPAKFLTRLKDDGLPHRIEAILARIAEGDLALSVFRPEFGTVGLGVTKLWSARPDRAWLLGQFEIAAFMSGASETVDLRFDSAWPICVAGRLLRESTFVVRGEGDDLTIASGSGSTICALRRQPMPGLPLWHAASDEPPICAGTLSTLSRSYGAWADEWGSPDPEPRQDDDPAFPGQIERAFAAMEQYAPEYYLWTASLLREVVAKGRPHETVTTSCSYLHNFGVVELCAPATLLETAEMLVHECSHQHYHLASWWTRMVDEGAPDVYSILKFTSRPLERLLLGFHAFGNALLMYDLLRRNRAPVDLGELDGRMRYVRSLVDALYLPLIENKAWLSESGRSIYQPLLALLVERGLVQPEDEMIASGVRLEVTAD